ncbi:hypothetical protein C8R45DRAFT_1101878 [Mycena sanguinolenta]|nr:hypothetical protein C8R45DRAFT_1101878 [Mycena sanguinolenta]
MSVQELHARIVELDSEIERQKICATGFTCIFVHHWYWGLLVPREDISCIEEFYSSPNTTISGSTTNYIGVAGYNEDNASDGEYANNADLATFLNEFAPDIAGNTFSLALLNGAENLQDDSGGLEGQIDIQYTVGIAGNVPVTYVLDLSDDAVMSYMLLTQGNPPVVFTMSHGNEESQFTLSTATSICDGYMQLAAMGVSMLFASGDAGATDEQTTCAEFVPVFPPTCP